MIKYFFKYHHTAHDLVTGKFSTPFLQEFFYDWEFFFLTASTSQWPVLIYYSTLEFLTGATSALAATSPAQTITPPSVQNTVLPP